MYNVHTHTDTQSHTAGAQTISGNNPPKGEGLERFLGSDGNVVFTLYLSYCLNVYNMHILFFK